MKKIITLLFFVGAFATSFAQYDQRQNNDNGNRRDDQYANSSNGQYDGHDRNDRKFYNNENSFSERDRDFQIAKINRDFNFQVQSIQNDRYMRHHERKVALRNAEYERDRQIQMINARFNAGFHNAYDRHDHNRYDSDRR